MAAAYAERRRRAHAAPPVGAAQPCRPHRGPRALQMDELLALLADHVANLDMAGAAR